VVSFELKISATLEVDSIAPVLVDLDLGIEALERSAFDLDA